MTQSTAIQNVDTLIRSVVNRYNNAFLNKTEFSQIEVDLLLSDLRNLYDSVKQIEQLLTYNSPLNVNQNVEKATPQKTVEKEVEKTPEPIEESEPAPENHEVIEETVGETDFNGNLLNETPEETVIAENEVVEEKDVKPEEKEKDFKGIDTFSDFERNLFTESQETKENQSHTIADNFKTETTSLNDQMSNKTSDLASNFKQYPIDNLNTAIGLNDKFTFISELFANNPDAYETNMKRINNAVNYDEAMYILDSLKNEIWEQHPNTVKRLTEFVHRRFI